MIFAVPKAVFLGAVSFFLFCLLWAPGGRIYRKLCFWGARFGIIFGSQKGGPKK